MNFKDIVLPNYNHSILSTITSVLKYYNVETNHKSLNTLDDILNKKIYKNIVLIILDGLGEHILNDISIDGYFNQSKIDCVTSVYPSTTTAALTTYYSGRTPWETGWIGWSQYFKEYGRAIDMFSHKESYMGEQFKNIKKDVFKTDMFYDSIYNQIEKANSKVKAFEIGPEYSERRGKRNIIADNIDEVISSIYDVCEISGEKFILAYVDNPDGLLHKYGTDSDEVKSFVLETEEKIKNMKNNLPEDTLVIISADHGHKNIDKTYTLLDYPEIYECLIMPPTLESRALTFWVKEDMKAIFEERFNNQFGDEFWLISKEEFLNKYKFLGEGKKHNKIDDFIGDYVAMSVGSSSIKIETYLTEEKKAKKSTHCGLSKDEMEVPVIALI